MSIPDDEAGALGRVALGLALAWFAAFQLFKLPVVLPVLLSTYGYDRTLAGAFMSIYALAGLCLSIWVGKLLSRHGPFHLVLGAFALFLVGIGVVLARPHSGLAVLAGRGLEGVAFAVLAIAGPVIANTYAPRRYLPIVIGLTAAWIPVGQLSATLLAPYSLAHTGWQGLWWAGAAGCLALGAWHLLVHRRDGRQRHAGAGSHAGTRISAAARRSLRLTGAIFMIWSGQYFAYMTWMPQYLIEVHGAEVSQALVGYVVPVLFVIVFNVVTGVLIRLGVSVGWLMAGAILSQCAVWWTIPLAGAGPSGIASLVAYGVGAGIVPACLFAMPSEIMGRLTNTAQAFGIIMTGRNLGVLIGPILLAEVFKLSGAWDLAPPVMGALTTLCLGLSVLLAARLRAAPRDGRGRRLARSC